MKLSFRGMTKNTIGELKELQDNIARLRRDVEQGETIDDLDDYLGSEHIEGLIMNVEAYHDIVLGLLQGKCSLDEAKDFLFSCGKLHETEHFGNLITFDTQPTQSVDKE